MSIHPVVVEICGSDLAMDEPYRGKTHAVLYLMLLFKLRLYHENLSECCYIRSKILFIKFKEHGCPYRFSVKL